MIPTTRALLLVSNSTNHGEVYLDHCMGEMMDILGGRRSLAFVPFALSDRESYSAAAKKRFEREEKVVVRAVTSDSRLRCQTVSPTQRPRRSGLSARESW